jgi:hypothetical protein
LVVVIAAPTAARPKAKNKTKTAVRIFIGPRSFPRGAHYDRSIRKKCRFQVAQMPQRPRAAASLAITVSSALSALSFGFGTFHGVTSGFPRVMQGYSGAGLRSRANEKRPPTSGDLFTDGRSGVPRRPGRTASCNGTRVPAIDAPAKCADEYDAEYARAS